jgi:tRNA1Val (adenine37-N6)-methyltransferase
MDTNCAMKLSTDAVLLGAWAEIGNSTKILDVGTGSGIIALMLAQRSRAHIYTIDLHAPSIEDADLNFKKSPWKERLQLNHSSFSDFINVCENKYDLIVSNPPYHSKSLKSPIDIVNLARHTTRLSHGELITGIKKILHLTGRFCVILPSPEIENFQQLAAIEGFWCLHACKVFPKTGKPANRILLEFGFQKPKEIIVTEIFIRNSTGEYHETYIGLTKEFYLNF